MNVALLLLLTPLLALADPEQAGRKALDHWGGGYPWYDRATDGVRRVDVSPPEQPVRAEELAAPGLVDTALMWLAWIGIALLLCLILYLLFRAYRRKAVPARSDSNEAGDAARIESLPLPVRSGRLDLLGEARRCYEQLDFRQAIIYLFSFELFELDKQQIVRLGKGKTNRQYLREMGPRPTLKRLVEQTMVAFEDVFFGNHHLDRGRFESCWSRLGEFESLASSGEG